MNNVRGAGIAVVISAVAFAAYHPPAGVAAAVFYLLAGLYFGAIYAIRGFGIVVGVHAIYDVVVVVLTGGES